MKKLCPISCCGDCRYEDCQEYGEWIAKGEFRFPDSCKLENGGEIPGWLKEDLNRFLDNYSLGAGYWKTHWDDAVEWVLSLKRGDE